MKITGYQVFEVKGRNAIAGMIFKELADAEEHAVAISGECLTIVKPVGEIVSQFKTFERLHY